MIGLYCYRARAVCCLLLLCAWGAGVVGQAPANAGEAVPITAFFGKFEGKSAASSDAERALRDLGVVIEPVDGGAFRVGWQTTVHEDDGDDVKQYSIEFRETGRRGVFASGMRLNMFGQRVPLDPLKGDPFVWARLKDRTLTVYALTVTHQGGYEMQVYDRTLRDDGKLTLRFRRYRDGEPVREVSGVLARVGP